MNTKKCSNCKETKSVDEFNWKNKQKGIRNSRCKSCIKLYRKSYYESYDRDKQINRIRQYQSRLTKRYNEWKATLCCEVCDESSTECLDFHHLDPSIKDRPVSKLVRLGSWKRVMAEAEKCVVLCSNCHRKVHAGKLTLL